MGNMYDVIVIGFQKILITGQFVSRFDERRRIILEVLENRDNVIPFTSVYSD